MEDRILSIKITEDEYKLILMALGDEMMNFQREITDEMPIEKQEEKLGWKKKFGKVITVLQTCKRYNEE